MIRLLNWLQKQLSGLQFRTTLILTAVVLASTGLTGAMFLRASSSIVLNQSNARARDLVQALALASALEIRNGDTDALLRIAAGVMPGTDLCYVLFTDNSGAVLASYQSGAGNLTDLLLNDTRHVSVEPIDRPRLLVHREYGARVDVVYPVRDPSPQIGDVPLPTIGYVRLGITLTEAEKRLASLAHNVIGLSILVTLLMVPLGYQIIHNVLGPTAKIREAARSIARGELDVRVDLNRNDELGELAASFNSMADDIAATQHKLVRLNSELEDRVLLRTQALEDANRRLKDMAARDSLTGLYNRRHFSDLLSQIFAESSRYGSNLSCIMIDLDNFKEVNDTLGHQAGDDLLRLTSAAILRSIREADIAIRYGGDEFIVLLPQTSPDEARHSAQRILDAFRTDIDRDMPAASIASLSIGLACRRNGEPRDGDGLVQLADEALYLAKAGGKNRITVVEPVQRDYRAEPL